VEKKEDDSGWSRDDGECERRDRDDIDGQDVDRVILRHNDVVVVVVMATLAGGDSKLVGVAPIAALFGVSLIVRALALRVSVVSCREDV